MAAGVLAGCAEGPAAWERVDATGLSTDLAPSADARAYAPAIETKDALAIRLMAALGEAIGTPLDQAEGRSTGPAGAVDVRRREAPRIAAEVARERGVRIGRTGVRLRNPSNAPPAWAASLLADQPAAPQAARSPDGTLGVVLPIRLAAL